MSGTNGTSGTEDRSETHLSALAIGRLMLAGATAAQWERADQHAASCEPCRQELAAARDARARYQAQTRARIATRLGSQAAHRLGAGRRMSWRIGVAIGLAVAASLLLLFLHGGRRRENVVAIKGEPSVQVFARRGDTVFSVHEGSDLAPGDAIRFVVSAAGASQVLIASADGAGNVTVYYPYGGGASAALPAAPSVVIPQTIVLDDAPGPERIFVFVSTHEIPAGPVLAALRELASLGHAAIRDTRLVAAPPPRAAQTSFLLEKRAAQRPALERGGAP